MAGAVLRYVVPRLMLLGILLAVLGVYMPVAACSNGGWVFDVIDSIRSGYERIATVLENARH